MPDSTLGLGFPGVTITSRRQLLLKTLSDSIAFTKKAGGRGTSYRQGLISKELTVLPLGDATRLCLQSGEVTGEQRSGTPDLLRLHRVLCTNALNSSR